ncbi:tetratricopeptide repeat protein [Nocardiopsis trehalosi]|uniref:tetratricopeptide repeat protein n=1 Tax=Nocardiopsis trehalosi TaxID=109329 RepID=UPI000AC49488|nr:tetratricopeptide repeat protein [Nocardiopsis trehalosi]
MAGRLLDEDPELAYTHAAFARRKASRMGVVREAAGIAAYSVGKWQEALSDLRAARRMTGRSNFLPVIADCERGLGRPERALEIARDPAAADLPVEDRVELRIVASGARRDLGEPEAALVELQIPELKERRARPYIARLFYAYADALLELDRVEEAREYFARASAVDRDGVTDADERMAALEGVEIVDIDDDVVWTDAEDPDADFDAAAEESDREAEAGAEPEGGPEPGSADEPETDTAPGAATGPEPADAEADEDTGATAEPDEAAGPDENAGTTTEPGEAAAQGAAAEQGEDAESAADVEPEPDPATDGSAVAPDSATDADDADDADGSDDAASGPASDPDGSADRA